MILPDGYSDIPAGKIAAVVTHLEMTARPARRDDPPGGWSLRKVDAPALAWYRDLYRRVGEDWLWSSRAQMNDAELAAIIHAAGIEVYALVVDGRDEGMLELDFRQPGQCELVYFGVTSSLVGTGAARFLMNRAMERAWSGDVQRVWVHTCTFDHPSAVAFYQRSGFIPFRRQIEIADDPRLDGTVSRDAAKHVPIIK
ncbi:GNAT family N-acetyltransferase [Bradyrhizobium sp. WYCCWR 13023]|uniref:GNAT family N-acetyltransferase n=1 Tax=Bradyrhizobium zhengyangense TaxID=2911009 RepID=A0A9X1R775_9BRAD|nr:GNAT family N-acetyltransferase [Bradyrhizobium zhengyangense]MCG2668900.1 GNAT family N-acetyltransferase [Bradyrhizobium zhengyangense]